MTDTESEYPHWKTALFGDDKAANLWCGIKYFVWHGAHLLLAAIGVLVFVLLTIYGKVTDALDYVVPNTAPTVPTPDLGIKEKLTSERASDVGILLFALSGVASIGILGYHLIVFVLANTMLFFATVGAITLSVAGLGIGIYMFVFINDRYNIVEHTRRRTKHTSVKTVRVASTAKEKSKQTPVFRRLVGYCPVNMSMEPRWFDTLAEKLFDE